MNCMQMRFPVQVKRKSKTNKYINRIMKLYCKGLSVREIERKIKVVKRTTVSEVIKKYKFLYDLKLNNDNTKAPLI